MVALVIEKSGEIKETFRYEIPFNETTKQSIPEYARANYGPNALVREMTNEEQANFSSRDPDSFATDRLALKNSAGRSRGHRLAQLHLWCL